MPTRYPFKPPAAGLLSTVHTMNGTGTSAVFLREGSGFANDSIGGATGTLNNGAAWGFSDAAGGVIVDFSAAVNANIGLGDDGMPHGNGDVTFFFGGIATVNGAYHTAGLVSGTTTDSYSFGIHDSNVWQLVLRNVVEIHSSINPVDAHLYTVGISYRKAVSAFFSVYDWTAQTLATQLVLDANAPAQVAASCTIGNIDALTESWRNILSFVLVFGNIALPEAGLNSLHAHPFQQLKQYYRLA